MIGVAVIILMIAQTNQLPLTLAKTGSDVDRWVVPWTNIRFGLFRHGKQRKNMWLTKPGTDLFVDSPYAFTVDKNDKSSIQNDESETEGHGSKKPRSIFQTPLLSRKNNIILSNNAFSRLG